MVCLLVVFPIFLSNFELCFHELLPLCEAELMVFGVLSLLMGHWIAFVAKICVKPSALMSSRFYPCSPNKYDEQLLDRNVVLRSDHFNSSMPRLLLEEVNHNFCPEVLFLIPKFKFQLVTIALMVVFLDLISK